MDWNYFKFIDAIALTGSLSKAAKILKIDTSTLSRHLQKIETDYAIKIFKRDGNKYVVTKAGTLWVNCAEKLRTHVDELIFAQGGRDPSIVLTSIEIFLNHYLLPRIDQFDSKLEFIGADRSLDLPRREADVAIRFGKPNSGDLVIQKLFSAGHAVYVKKDFLKSIDPDLRKNKWVTLNDEFSDIEDVRWFREHVGDESIAFKASSCQQILTLLQHAPLLAVLPCYMGDRHRDLMRVKETGIIFQRVAWLVTHRELAAQKHIRDFIAQLKKMIQQDELLLHG